MLPVMVKALPDVPLVGLIDVIAGAGIVDSSFEVVYGRAGRRHRSTGRELWVFREFDGDWRAVWRTMMDLEETALDGGGAAR